ncbi:thymidylate synthase [Aminobacter anthyllidis]|uniref:Thymidylate synthase n=1 Tax=Aminobacter anthyllidis TaxID=1035067 RepID=A0A9X1AEV1_9HYPH|nr:thymidylate synthase [Aminobacter anthyllidis]MBT1158474.1 thymidylate synthase [Aminobacter anthyllidis]
MTKSSTPRLIDADNLSVGWATIVQELMRPGTRSISPLIFSLTGFGANGDPQENHAIRNGLDQMLGDIGKRDCENVAFTIFPQKHYLLSGGNREEFFDLYREAFPRIQELNPRNNRRGSYFQRLVDYEGGNNGLNQLDWILKEYERNPHGRRSKWQATTFDPYRDYSSTAQLEFPCLQQVSFTFSDDDGLIVNAFYATQQIIRKAYGNYLGLSRLGKFMAHEMHLKLERLNVFVGVAQADEAKRSDPHFQALMKTIDVALDSEASVEA